MFFDSNITRYDAYTNPPWHCGTPFVYTAALIGQASASPPNAATAGDVYNQSLYFKSDATGLVSSSIEINNTPLMPQPLDDDGVHNETLVALGNLNQDMSSSIYPGCLSFPHFWKYYATHIVSLENIQQGDFYESGLDGKSCALNIALKIVFGGAFSTTEFFIPYIFAKCTRVMVVNAGHAITIIV